MESSFELGERAYAAGIEWDDAMRLASLRIRGGRAARDGAMPVVELFAPDGAPLAPGRPPDVAHREDAAYILERVREGDADLRCDLRRRDGS
jgi:hypothetical protein